MVHFTKTYFELQNGSNPVKAIFPSYYAFSSQENIYMENVIKFIYGHTQYSYGQPHKFQISHYHVLRNGITVELYLRLTRLLLQIFVVVRLTIMHSP